MKRRMAIDSRDGFEAESFEEGNEQELRVSA